MFMTLYYMAATWIQSWRLNSMRTKILQLLSHNGSIVMYKEPDLVDLEGGLGLQLPGASSTCCMNNYEARVGDLLWYVDSKRGCSIFPQQKINVTEWISFHNDRSLFPLELSGSPNVGLCDTEKLHLLLEADLLKATSARDSSYIQIEQFGIPRAWKVDDYLAIIMETDVDHLAKLCTNFMMNKLTIDDGMELIRIESVGVEGRPCLLLNIDSIPVTRSLPKIECHLTEDQGGSMVMVKQVGPLMSPEQWRSHIELLQTLSAAAKGVSGHGGSVEGPSGPVVMAGDKELGLDLPAVLDMPDEERSIESFHSLPQEEFTKEVPDRPSSPRESKSSDSFCSLGSASTMSLGGEKPRAQDQVVKHGDTSPAHKMKPILKVAWPPVKPPNVLVYSESAAALDNTTAVLHSTLQRHKYTVYPVTRDQLMSSPWSDNTRLLVVCGSVPDTVAPLLLGFLLRGGRVLCLCSDLLHLVLPTFRTAEVRERELVRFSYGRWKQVRMMHHIFCYQASPAKAKFSREPSDADAPPRRLPAPPKPPPSVEILDSNNEMHTLAVQVLGAEETWHTPSLLLATVGASGGKVVFSQVHLEVDPAQYEGEESKFSALQQSNKARIEILQDLLTSHLGLEVCDANVTPTCTPAYFLGRHELKLDFLNKMQEHYQGDNLLKLSRLTLQFCGKGVEPSKASSVLMPVLVHSCPAQFSTVVYFESLQTQDLGRLVIFSDVMTSSMDVLDGAVLQHGLAVVPLQQVNGSGRGGNVWLSPEGCAMFSLQIHMPLSSYLGQHTPFLQHIVALSVVNAVCSLPGYQDLNLRLKWPNDIYVGDSIKIGGLIVNSTIHSSLAVCNVGCGTNLNNKLPTTCINSLIEDHNKAATTKLPLLSCEKLLAIVFSELERLITLAQSDQVDLVLQLYYSYWLHSEAMVTVVDARGENQETTVIGIDDYGFLQVRTKVGTSFSVHPDGNSFDMMRGLVSPKVK